MKVYDLYLEPIQLLLPNFILYVYCIVSVLKLCKAQFIIKCLLNCNNKYTSHNSLNPCPLNNYKVRKFYVIHLGKEVLYLQSGKMPASKLFSFSQKTFQI
jgi:hypothetical protein